jgi:hypothetical protein
LTNALLMKSSVVTAISLGEPTNLLYGMLTARGER